MKIWLDSGTNIHRQGDIQYASDLVLFANFPVPEVAKADHVEHSYL